MREEYDFGKGRRGAVLASPGKTRITMIKAARRGALGRSKDAVMDVLTATKLREVRRQELSAA